MAKKSTLAMIIAKEHQAINDNDNNTNNLIQLPMINILILSVMTIYLFLMTRPEKTEETD